MSRTPSLGHARMQAHNLRLSSAALFAMLPLAACGSTEHSTIRTALAHEALRLAPDDHAPLEVSAGNPVEDERRAHLRTTEPPAGRELSWRPTRAPSANRPQTLQHPRPQTNFDARLRLGTGTFENEFSGGADSKTDADFFALQFEGYSDQGFGGGIRLEGIGTDNDLFSNFGIADSQADLGELSLYFCYRLEKDRFRMPIRVGPTFINYEVKDNTFNQQVDYNTVGARVEIEPEISIIQSPNTSWGLFANLGFGFGLTRIETSPSSFEADSIALLGKFEFGTRAQLGPILMDLGYVLRQMNIDESEVVNGNAYSEVDTTFSGVQFTIGGRF